MKSRPNENRFFDNKSVTLKRGAFAWEKLLFWSFRGKSRASADRVVPITSIMLNRLVFGKKIPIHEPIFNYHESNYSIITN